jgi:aryl-alcohol dehydrogenase-like predicted oxidoreductase
MCRVWRQGKARHIGVSNYSATDIARCLTVGPVHSLQACFHMFRRELALVDLPFCAAHGIGTIIWGPLAHGLLTGRYTRESPPALSSDDWRAAMPIMRGEGFVRCADTLEQLRAFAAQRGRTMIDVTLAWTLAQPGVTAVVTGARSAAQLGGQVAGAAAPLSSDDLAEVNRMVSSAPSWAELGGDPEYGGHHILPISERPALG